MLLGPRSIAVSHRVVLCIAQFPATALDRSAWCGKQKLVPFALMILYGQEKAPDARSVKEPEFGLSSGTGFLVAGKSATEVDNVTQPTMIVYSPKGKNTGAAVIVFPGGGYYVLAIDLEGTEACDWRSEPCA